MADETLDLFALLEPPAPERRIGEPTISDYQKRLAKLANAGLFVGMSSWKYAGWFGMIYDESRYLMNRKVSTKKFEQSCLDEYAETFRSVCIDAGYYQFPTVDYIGGMCAQVPAGFKFAIKVTDDITIKRFPTLARFGVPESVKMAIEAYGARRV